MAHKSISKIGVAIAVFIGAGVKIALKLGLGTGMAMAEVEASKNQAWSDEFRNGYTEGCVGSFNEIDITPESKQTICGCLTKGTEEAHILPTKFLATRSEESVTEEYKKLTDDFMNSDAGQALSSKCLKLAGIEIKEDRLPADASDQSAQQQ